MARRRILPVSWQILRRACSSCLEKVDKEFLEKSRQSVLFQTMFTTQVRLYSGSPEGTFRFQTLPNFKLRALVGRFHLLPKNKRESYIVTSRTGRKGGLGIQHRGMQGRAK